MWMRPVEKQTAHLKDKSIHNLIKRCQEKEKAGWECVRKIERVETYTKNFNRDGKFYTYSGFASSGFYEAIYQKEAREI